jgi:hypothetical protein
MFDLPWWRYKMSGLPAYAGCAGVRRDPAERYSLVVAFG